MTSPQIRPNAVVIRFDDIGASSKRYEVYSSIRRTLGPLGTPGDWLFLKYLPGLRAWGPYREIRAKTWQNIFGLVERYNAKITLGVTATWVESKDRLVPYPDKFPEEAALLKVASDKGLIEIANHGLTHCIAEDNAFKPKLFSSNRRFHREFSPLMSEDVQNEHLIRSQYILQEYFETAVTTFVPPGRNFSATTLVNAHKAGLQYLMYNVRTVGVVFSIPAVLDRLSAESADYEQSKHDPISLQQMESLLAWANPERHYQEIALHDRDIVLKGQKWFEALIGQHVKSKFMLAAAAGSEFSPMRADS